MKLRTKQDTKEKLLTILIFTGIFLPVRLLFYNYVSQYWIGSFGLITGIMILLMVLSRKEKLGKFGHIINRQIMSFSRGKFGKFAMIQTIFFIYVFSLAIYGIENAPEDTKKVITEMLAAEGVNNLNDLGQAKNLGFDGTGEALGILFGLLIILIPNKLGFTLYSVINDMTNNWLLHFITVYLIETVEVLGLVVYFRYFYKVRN